MLQSALCWIARTLDVLVFFCPQYLQSNCLEATVDLLAKLLVRVM